MASKKNISCICTNCEEVVMKSSYEARKRSQHFCNQKCMFEYRRRTGFYKGENNSNYKGGLTEVVCVECGNTKEVKAYSLKETKVFYCSSRS